MAKKGIHPEQHKVKIIFLSRDKSVENTEIETFSAVNHNMVAEVRIEEHPAWQKDRTKTVMVNQSVKKFSDKSKRFFGDN